MIGPQQKVEIANLIDYADKHVVSNLELQNLLKGIGKPVGDNYNFCIMLPVGFRVVFSFEMQLESKKYRHISVSFCHTFSSYQT